MRSASSEQTTKLTWPLFVASEHRTYNGRQKVRWVGTRIDAFQQQQQRRRGPHQWRMQIITTITAITMNAQWKPPFCRRQQHCVASTMKLVLIVVVIRRTIQTCIDGFVAALEECRRNYYLVRPWRYCSQWCWPVTPSFCSVVSVVAVHRIREHRPPRTSTLAIMSQPKGQARARGNSPEFPSATAVCRWTRRQGPCPWGNGDD